MIKVRAIRKHTLPKPPPRPSIASQVPSRRSNVGILEDMLLDRDELEASICRDSFADFVKRFWGTVIDEPLVWNWHMQVLCDDMQEIAERVFRGEPKEADRVYNVPPGTSKSTICSVMFPVWVWTRMPSAKSICGSYSHDLAMDLSRKSRKVVKSDKFCRLFPGASELSDDQDAKGYFINRAGGFRYCVGTGGTITGFHGHFLIVDDPLDPNAAAKISQADLKEANRWVGETLSQRKVDKKVSVTVLVMQRLHQNDPSQVLLDRRKKGVKVHHIKLPAKIDGTGFDQVSPRKYALQYVNGFLDPVRLSQEVLNEALVTLGQFGYSGQMLQNPVPLGGGMFKTARIAIEEPPHLVDFVALRRYWDKAGTDRKQARGAGARTAGVKMGLDSKGRFWVLHVVRGQWAADEREAIILQTARTDGKRVRIGLEQEPGSGGKESAQRSARMLAGFSVTLDRPVGDKTIRADPFASQVNIGNVYLAPGDWNEEYLEELKFFPLSRTKDQVDASGGAFAGLTTIKRRAGGMKRRNSHG